MQLLCVISLNNVRNIVKHFDMYLFILFTQMLYHGHLGIQNYAFELWRVLDLKNLQKEMKSLFDSVSPERSRSYRNYFSSL